MITPHPNCSVGTGAEHGPHAFFHCCGTVTCLGFSEADVEAVSA